MLAIRLRIAPVRVADDHVQVHPHLGIVTALAVVLGHNADLVVAVVVRGECKLAFRRTLRRDKDVFRLDVLHHNANVQVGRDIVVSQLVTPFLCQIVTDHNGVNRQLLHKTFALSRLKVEVQWADKLCQQQQSEHCRHKQ